MGDHAPHGGQAGLTGPDPLPAPSPEAVEAGRRLFAQSCDFVAGVVDVGGLPPGRLPEVAFAGRSNVGKSSLINALTGRKTLARTSHTPGRTRQLNFFDLGGRLMLVDMPGYGYAQAPKAQVDAWTKLVFDYLKGRVTLKRVYLLIDARHGIKKNDEEVMDLLDRAAVSYQIVLTKADKIKAAGVPRLIEETAQKVKRRPAAYPAIIATSSEKGLGLDELRGAIALAVSGG